MSDSERTSSEFGELLRKGRAASVINRASVTGKDACCVELGVMLEKTVVERAVGFRAAFEAMQRHLRMIVGMRSRDELVERLLHRVLARLGDLVFAFVGLGDALQFIVDGAAQQLHLIAQVDDSEVLGAVADGPVGELRAVIRDTAGATW